MQEHKVISCMKKEKAMRIKDITIKDFRGFTDRHFEFDEKLNVVLGNNTTGKTTLLHAVQIALGAFLQELTLISGCSRNAKDSDTMKKYSELTKSFQKQTEKPSFEVDAVLTDGTYNFNTQEYISQDVDVKWKRQGSKNSRRNAGELMDIVAQMVQKRRDADFTKTTSVLPLMLSFGASRLENNYNGAEKTKARASREQKAYKCALDEKVDFKSAFDWIYRYDKELAKGREFAGTDEAFLNALYEAIPALKQIEIDRKNNEFTTQIQMAKDTTPYWLTYDMMSDGFKAMINIVSEIAYRCIELNGFLGKNTVKNTPGIVMIDEVDLYLHPHWQQHILSDLQSAFPLIQFIVTTHSPFIVQSVESRNVITLDGTKGDNDPNKRSIEEIVISEMNLDTVRSAKYNEMVEKAERYYQLVKTGREKTYEAEEIKKELDRIEAQFSEEPAYVALLRAERRSL